MCVGVSGWVSVCVCVYMYIHTYIGLTRRSVRSAFQASTAVTPTRRRLR